jgi:hypothetical protein
MKASHAMFDGHAALGSGVLFGLCEALQRTATARATPCAKRH